MTQIYDAGLKARLTLDDNGRVRGINHVEDFWQSGERPPRRVALSYLRTVADTLEVPRAEFDNAHQHVNYLQPAERSTEYRLSEEKNYFDATTEGFFQTHLNVPVWGAGVSVTMKDNPTRVVSAVNTSLKDLNPTMPPESVIDQWRSLFKQVAKERALRELAEGPERSETAPFIADLLGGRAFKKGGGKAAAAARHKSQKARLLNGRFFIYRYDPAKRFRNSAPSPVPKDPDGPEIARDSQKPRMPEAIPTLPLAAIERRIVAGADYMVAELIFFYPTPQWGEINWRALVELVTGSVLYLRPLSDSVDGDVFLHDPITESGNAANGPTATNATLNPFQDTETLPNLDAAVGGVQSLTGSRVALSDVETPTLSAPTEAAGADFDGFNTRTNNFTAVNAYFHANRFFDLVEDLGFNLATYFDGTTFPVPVDHRGLGDDINAHCVGNALGRGIGHLCYALADDTDTTNPMGIACDWRVHLHELGGHGILHDHVWDPNFNFAHSAGDSFAMILSDPESQAPDRFHLSPFVPVITRRSDRGASQWSLATIAMTNNGSGYTSSPTVTITGGGGTGAVAFVPATWISFGQILGIYISNPGTGFTSAPTITITGGGGTGATATSTIGTWAWGGGMDQGGYLSEQLLSTTLFRVYRSIGGDSPDINRRRFAARYMAYLILRTVGTLTAATNPSTALAFANSLIATDALNWTSESIDGGAYGKVLRWAFEKQGMYQPGSPAPGTVTDEGDPPDVDVYIDDGRGGEYDYQYNHWSTGTIWNRLSADGGTSHEQPDSSATNYMYVKIKNRGTQTANNVVVHGYHTKPAAGLLWPADFEAMTTASISAGTLGANNSEEKTVGPFHWTPNINAYGHDCILMIVSATDDPSNIDNFTAAEEIPEWRLVPNDNNVGQRNVHPVPGGGGSSGLVAGLHGFSFWVGNPNPRRGMMDVLVQLPEVLAQRGWRLGFRGLRSTRFALKPREQQELIFDLEPGAPFERADVEAATDRDIVVTVKADGGVIGGMTYRLDPALKRPRFFPGQTLPGRERHPCIEEARRLLDCLDLPSDKVCKVGVEKIILGVKMKDDDCC